VKPISHHELVAEQGPCSQQRVISTNPNPCPTISPSPSSRRSGHLHCLRLIPLQSTAGRVTAGRLGGSFGDQRCAAQLRREEDARGRTDKTKPEHVSTRENALLGEGEERAGGDL